MTRQYGERRRFDRIDVVLLLGLLGLAAVTRLYDLTGESLWYDEAYSVWSSAMDIASLRRLWEWQIEFPLYYLMLHYWMRVFGQSELAVRAYGALAGVLTIVPVYFLGRSLFGRKAGSLATFLLAVNPYHVWYSQEVRMYAWAVFATMCSAYAYWRILRGGRWGWWLAYTVLTGLIFHLHYFVGWLVLAENVHYLTLAWLEHRRQSHGQGGAGVRGARIGRWIASQMGILLIALPAFLVFRTKLVALNQWDWLAERYGRPGLAQLLDLMVTYVAGTTFPGPSSSRWLIVFLAVALAGWAVLRGIWPRLSRDRSHATDAAALSFVVLALTLPLLLVFGLGQITSVWVPRYLVLFLPFFLLLVGLGISMLQVPLGAAAVVVLAAGAILSLSAMYGTAQKEDWRGVTAYLTAQAHDQDQIILMDEECRVPFDYYNSRDYGDRRVEVGRFADDADLDGLVVQVADEGDGGRLWLVVSHADASALEARLASLPNLRQVGSPQFVGVDLKAYEWSTAQ